MINGAHLMFYSPDPDADRAFLRDVLGLPFVHASDPDDPWLIFRLPPAEAGVHPTDGEPSTGVFLLCDDIAATVEELSSRGAQFTDEPQDRGWGIATAIRLPSGAELGIYEPRHASARGD
jgi:catechol 2,3-dioxygenase-like lactoylglutathione lyase family enzyme